MDELTRLALAEQCWAIENYHRGLKQCCGVERCQARSARAQRNHIGMAIRAFLRLELAFLHHRGQLVRGQGRDHPRRGPGLIAPIRCTAWHQPRNSYDISNFSFSMSDLSDQALGPRCIAPGRSATAPAPWPLAARSPSRSTTTPPAGWTRSTACDGGRSSRSGPRSTPPITATSCSTSSTTTAPSGSGSGPPPRTCSATTATARPTSIRGSGGSARCSTTTRP